MNKKIGSVLVIGGGIGGIQASLDLVEAGFKVYLLDKSCSLGGTMSQLDKTFPTNDCAMCIMSPKLAEAGRNKNIEIITFAELKELSGTLGHFTASIIRHPARVDPDKCNGCGICREHCPLECKSEYNEGLTARKAIFTDYPQAVPNTHRIDKKSPPCELACPVRLDIREYAGLIASEKFAEALEIIKKKLPFPATIGRICTRPCERECIRGKEMEEPVAICHLKKFVADLDFTNKKPAEKIEDKYNEKIGVIGGGPAGLTTAYYLRMLGYPVIIFEAGEKLGGMLRYGIPEYRLPEEILDREINDILSTGIQVRYNTYIGKDFNGIREDDHFKALFIGVGAWQGLKLNLSGENSEGVISGIDFLKNIKTGKSLNLKGKIVIIGGGNVAIDSARTALRCGADEVNIYYRRTLDEMPAYREEIYGAIDEGVNIHYLTGPAKIFNTNGKLTSIEMIRYKLGEADPSGRKRPVPVEGTGFTVKADYLIVAIGQGVNLSVKGLNMTVRQTVAVDRITGETSLKGIFAAGDVETGPYTAIDAIAGGIRAAESIDRYLRGKDLREGRETEEAFPVKEGRAGFTCEFRQRISSRKLSDAIKDFNEIEKNFTKEQAVKEGRRCLNCRACLGCGICSDVCEAGAVIYEEKERIEVIEIGSVILATGFEEFSPLLKSEYGYGRYDNVVTSIEFERMLSATGPFSSVVMRLSDGDVPQKIAWIQCIGSRDKDHDYCSSVCCMYATKEAIIVKEHLPFVEPVIFYMDIRAYGKNFEHYYNRAKDELNIRYIRCNISRVVEDPLTKNLRLTYIGDDGKVCEEEFHMVVLSVGMRPQNNFTDLAEKLDIKINRHGFCHTNPFLPVETSRQGIYVCGALEAPKDIPETITQGSAASSLAGLDISEARNSLIVKEAFPEEKNITGEEPRIGVFLCHCGVNIGSVINMEELKRYSESLRDVVYTDKFIFTCSTDSLKSIKKSIKEHNINRVVVASCSPRTHEVIFQQTIGEAGLNPYLFEMANIRDQCSWVHMRHKIEATEKSKTLLRMAVANARELKPLKMEYVEVKKSALIIGGGAAGMTSALNLADQGYKVYLIEKEEQLGGNLSHLYYTIEGNDVSSFYEILVNSVSRHLNIQVFTSGEVLDHSGVKGNFKTTVISKGQKHILEHGIIILATGGKEYKPDEYLYGKHPSVITQRELEKRIVSRETNEIKKIVMIQCVGSRIPERPYCSRICCSIAIKNALKLKELNPDIEIHILYRDIRTYGFLEEYYTKARKMGIIFTSYDLKIKPEVMEEEGKIVIYFHDNIINRTIKISPDLLILSTAVIPEENSKVANLFKIQKNTDGFYLEAHVKLRPVDFSTEGIFMAGLGHSPKLLSETISQASAASSRALGILSKDRLQTGGAVAKVDEDKCASCLICVRTCPFNVPCINEKGYSYINPVLCQGCGNCAAECPQKAIDVQRYTDSQIFAKTILAIK